MAKRFSPVPSGIAAVTATIPAFSPAMVSSVSPNTSELLFLFAGAVMPVET